MFHFPTKITQFKKSLRYSNYAHYKEGFNEDGAKRGRIYNGAKYSKHLG